MVWCGPTDEVELSRGRNDSPDIDRDHGAVHTQLTARRDEAERRRQSAQSRAESAEREAGEWREQVERYDSLIRKLGTP